MSNTQAKRRPLNAVRQSGRASRTQIETNRDRICEKQNEVGLIVSGQHFLVVDNREHPLALPASPC